MKCPNCGSLDVRSHFGITELAYYECGNCGRAISNNYTPENHGRISTQNTPRTVTHGIPNSELVVKTSKVIRVKVRPSLIEAVNAVTGSSVSEFCRQAIIEKLERVREE